MNDRCAVYDPDKGQCACTKNLMQVLVQPPRPTDTLFFDSRFIIAICPKHERKFRRLAEERKEQP